MARKRWGKPVNDVVKTEEMPSVATKKAEKHKPISPAEWTKHADEVLRQLYEKHDRKRRLIRESIKAEHAEAFEFLAGLSTRRFDREIGLRWRAIGGKPGSEDSSSTEVGTPVEEEPVVVEQQEENGEQPVVVEQPGDENPPTLERTDSVGDLVQA